jgi:hypothetical protein
MNALRAIRFAAAMACGLLTFAYARADEVVKIEDNSFLIEEAYNQEPGIIQHIQTFQRMSEGAWSYTFTEEWPLASQAHQISLTVPFSGFARENSGIGDVALNYRWQARDVGGIAIAPRATLLVATGDYRRGFGAGSAGFQVNLPVSIEIAPRFVTHWNLGGTWSQQSRAITGLRASTQSWAGGASIVWITHPNANLMFETYAGSTEGVEADGSVSGEEFLFLNPGMRFAVNFESGLQIVPGFSTPWGVGPSGRNEGVLFYLSLEHRAWGSAPSP